ncbi:hypothetical protein C8F01DRAFT_1105140 [Mycena amicta]|nr:hypothetical protein C8F01DRAFT_1105140 [Mycena amicta]
MLLVVLAYGATDWKQIVSVIGPAAVYKSETETVGIFAVIEGPVPDLEAIAQSEKLDIRLYERLDPAQTTAIPTEANIEQFNAWYTEEHIPMLKKVPGWRSFDAIQATEYLALHEWTTKDAFGTEEFRAATNTPWRTTVVEQGVHSKERMVLEYVHTL